MDGAVLTSCSRRRYPPAPYAPVGSGPDVGNACDMPPLLSLLTAGGTGAAIVAVARCYAAGLGAHAWMAPRRAAAPS